MSKKKDYSPTTERLVRGEIPRIYRRSEIVDELGVGSTTVSRWAERLEDTNLVWVMDGIHYYTQDFVDFMRARKEQHGRASLPDAQEIQQLVNLWHNTAEQADNLSQRLDYIAELTGQPIPVLYLRYQQLGKIRKGK